MIKESINWFKTIDIKYKVTIIILSLLVLSPLGSNKLLVLGGVFVPEILIVLLGVIFFKKSKYILNYVISSLTYLFIIISCILLIFLGYLNGENVTISYSVCRAFVFLCIGWGLTNYVYYHSKTPSNLLIILVIFTTIWSLVYFTVFSQTTKAPFSIPLMMLIFYFSYLSKDIRMVFLAIFTLIFISIISAFRLYWIYSTIFILAFILGYFKNILFIDNGTIYIRKSNAMMIMSFIFVMPLFVFLLSDSVLQWFSADASRYNQIVWKSTELYNSIIYGDNLDESTYIRMLQFQYYINNWSDFILPSGFYDNTNFIGGSSAIRDTMYYYMSIVFGVFASVFIVFFIVKNTVKNIVRSKYEKIPRVALISIFSIIFLFNGSSLTIISHSFYLGIVISILIKPEINILNRNY